MNKKHLILVIIILFLLSTFNGVLSGEDVKIPKKALKLEKKGDKATKAKELDKAMELYKQALEIFPDMETVHYKIAYIFAVSKKYKESIDELFTTLKINGNNENAKKMLMNISLKHANQLFQKRNLEEANNFFLKISEIEGLNAIDDKFLKEINYWIGYTFFQLKKMNEANDYLLKFVNTPEIVTTFPNFYATSNYLLGLNYSQANDVENSNKYLKVFVDVSKDKPDNKYLGFAKYIMGMNNFNSLKTEVQKIEKAKTKNNLLASDKKIVELSKYYKDIEDNLLFAIEKDSTLENAYVLLGNYYYLKKDIDNSIKYYKLLIEKFPGSADFEIYKVFLKDIEKRKK